MNGSRHDDSRPNERLTDDPRHFERLLSLLPDTPRFVETRSMLLSGRCEVTGVEENPVLSFVSRSQALELISVVGRPTREAIQKAVLLNGESGVLLAGVEAGDHVAAALPNWRFGSATLYLLGDALRLPPPPGSVQFVSHEDLSRSSHIPADLKDELIAALRRSPVAAAIEESLPVSFCYATATTEDLWDVSIDTLAEYRNRGYAALCVAFMIDFMSNSGRQPVWGAEHDNIASIRLAEKMGFVPVDRILVFRLSDSRVFA